MKDIVFECPQCSQSLEAPEDMKELFVECPNCTAIIQVPAEAGGGDKPPAPARPADHKNDEQSGEDLKGSTIRIDLPPNLGIPEAPRRKIIIRRKP